MGALVAPPRDLAGAVWRTRVRPGTLALWYLGGAGYVAKSAATTLLLDPFVGPSNPPDWVRAIPPPCAPDALPEVAATLLTHEHSDHADPVALAALGRRAAGLVVGSAACIAVAAQAGVSGVRSRVLSHGERLMIGDIAITAVAMVDPAAVDPNGYVLELPGLAALFCGDGLYSPDFVTLASRWRLDAICASVGANPPGKHFYMDEIDAARAARDCGAARLIPQHHDLWQGLTLDPRRVATVARWYCPGVRVTPARYGRRLTVTAR